VVGRWRDQPRRGALQAAARQNVGEWVWTEGKIILKKTIFLIFFNHKENSIKIVLF
jgi:hypothetical protein